jgi:hypothetical protein
MANLSDLGLDGRIRGTWLAVRPLPRHRFPEVGVSISISIAPLREDDCKRLLSFVSIKRPLQ